MMLPGGKTPETGFSFTVLVSILHGYFVSQKDDEKGRKHN
jgi:hypothetical protein